MLQLKLKLDFIFTHIILHNDIASTHRWEIFDDQCAMSTLINSIVLLPSHHPTFASSNHPSLTLFYSSAIPFYPSFTLHESSSFYFLFYPSTIPPSF